MSKAGEAASGLVLADEALDVDVPALFDGATEFAEQLVQSVAREGEQQAAAKALYLRQRGEEELARKHSVMAVVLARRVATVPEMQEREPGGRGKKLSGATEGFSKDELHTYRLIAEVPDEGFRKYVTESAVPTKTGAAKLGAKIRRERRVAEVLALGDESSDALADLGGLVARVASGDCPPFGTIYIDPPWQYGNQGTRGATNNHYSTMPLEEIAALPVEQLAADEAHLHLWTTSVFLPECFDLMRGWGFDYKSYLVWIKPNFGLGNYYRGPCELLLLGTRGGCKFLRHDVRGELSAKSVRHSAKPDAFRALVETLSPGPRLEMFARQAHEGWVSWGDECAPVAQTLFSKEVADA